MQEHPEDLEKIEKLKDLIAWQVRLKLRIVILRLTRAVMIEILSLIVNCQTLNACFTTVLNVVFSLTRYILQIRQKILHVTEFSFSSVLKPLVFSEILAKASVAVVENETRKRNKI